MNILVTGGTGFLGSSLIEQLSPHCISVLGRNQLKLNSLAHHYGVIDNKSSYEKALINIEVLIHCAARVHVMNDSAISPLEAFREVNTAGTLNLAQQAADAGVKRFIFISTIKVNGESTELGFPFKPDDNFIPIDPYGLSKYEAEVGLQKIAKQTGMEVVILRPPLVYGPGVKANFASMMKWINIGIPLPLGGIKENRRSLVSLDNLVDLIITCIEHPNAANQTFLVSDDNDVSTSQLLANMASALDAPNRLLPIPSTWFTVAAKLIGKTDISQRLCGSLQVDISKTKEMLNWRPPYRSVESMKKTADAFLENLSLNK
ncbi:SDR family oxidoreductase [Paraglaciecola sp. MB-3u-78]|uniref:UDP-glucose 4-epimerase family protein n=1 Tax=Paraglaciecola sp. MB-3u-78 TaxID=2058332 RepID=UPI000C33EA94|nr:SDR family oxidoreductase [Paraglaciecola sp. MB-3u-78]PKG98933.1 UDP-glucose 4-epimerase [Paraglaciecola sp. MB-3u-78]